MSKIHEKLILGHLDYQNSLEEERHYLIDLAINGQKPHTMFIGCCDSRVIPEQFTNSKPGELFVIRNIGNHVPKYKNSIDSMESAIIYAIKYLSVQHIVICGHTNCGGITAKNNLKNNIVKDNDEYLLDKWIMNLKPSVEENVLNSLTNIIDYPIIKKNLDSKKIILHAWIYDLENVCLKIWNGKDWLSASDIKI